VHVRLGGKEEKVQLIGVNCPLISISEAVKLPTSQADGTRSLDLSFQH
jgi:hypothetical protein